MSIFNSTHKLAAAVALFASISGIMTTAEAQAPLADRAVKQILGNWTAADDRMRGREIKFFVKDYNPVFEDMVQPGIILTGSVRQDTEGGDFVLIYQKEIRCRYSVSYRVGPEDGTAMTFRLVGSYKPESAAPFRCIEGKLERSR